MTHALIKCAVAIGVAGMVAMASTASIAQVMVGPGPYGPTDNYGPRYGYGYAGSQWQYRGGPRSDSTRDILYGSGSDLFSYQGPNRAEMERFP